MVICIFIRVRIVNIYLRLWR